MLMGFKRCSRVGTIYIHVLPKKQQLNIKAGQRKIEQSINRIKRKPKK
jgi:hypothetical protein